MTAAASAAAPVEPAPAPAETTADLSAAAAPAVAAGMPGMAPAAERAARALSLLRRRGRCRQHGHARPRSCCCCCNCYSCRSCCSTSPLPMLWRLTRTLGTTRSSGGTRGKCMRLAGPVAGLVLRKASPRSCFAWRTATYASPRVPTRHPARCSLSHRWRGRACALSAASTGMSQCPRLAIIRWALRTRSCKAASQTWRGCHRQRARMLRFPEATC
mmetsp:Transcript_39520/g.117545  ORF Transcript_39520/g.117545 Transcript_39520/m.117545 type:complete len:216 (+) Transcript_39520:495-1142(+)